VLQPAAFVVVDKFLLYVQRQGLALRCHYIYERRVIPHANTMTLNKIETDRTVGWGPAPSTC
jgi:hypothetical protein